MRILNCAELCHFWQWIGTFCGLALMAPSATFYFSRSEERKKSATSFVELCFLSIGAFLALLSLLSMITTLARVRKNRQKMANLAENDRRQDDVQNWVCFHQRFSFGVNPETVTLNVSKREKTTFYKKRTFCQNIP